MSPIRWTAKRNASVLRSSLAAHRRSLFSRSNSAMTQSPASLGAHSVAGSKLFEFIGMSTKCQFAVSGRISLSSSAQLATDASEWLSPSNRATSATAAGVRRRWPISAMIECPSCPQPQAVAKGRSTKPRPAKIVFKLGPLLTKCAVFPLAENRRTRITAAASPAARRRADSRIWPLQARPSGSSSFFSLIIALHRTAHSH